jgi:3-deoxy-D-manno-octulosonic-acid transferase
MGILSSVYRYGTLAYIGGGFGNGIHNTLEAATYGLPVVFGPNYKRFKEACDLLDLSSGFSITNFVELKSIFHTLLINENLTMKSGQSASNYVNQMRGGTDILLSQIML